MAAGFNTGVESAPQELADSHFPFYAGPVLYVVLQLLVAQHFAPSTHIPGICRIAIAAVVLWVAFHLVIVPKYGNVLLFKVFEVPLWVKCPVEFDKCDTGDVDGWSVWHLVDHFCMGVMYPHIRYEGQFVLFQSLMCELGELIGGERARFIVDPGVNLLGYILGVCANRIFVSCVAKICSRGEKEDTTTCIKFTELPSGFSGSAVADWEHGIQKRATASCVV
jgi:hypothetical protein